MADDMPPRQMSLIPYPFQNGEVVLRRGNAIVVRNTHSHQLSVHNDPDQQAVELTECPYCHRPLRDDLPRDAAEDNGRPRSSFPSDRPLVNPEYWRMLSDSQRPSPNPSAGPSTPAGRFVPPALRSGRSRDVSGTQYPPTGAEFVGSEPSTTGRQGISKSAFSPGFFKQFFKELKILGAGGNGVVLLVEHIMDGVSLGQFACKRIPVGDNHEWLEKVLLEVKLLQKIPHNNLVKYHWVWLEDHTSSKFAPTVPCLWILQEYCNGGDLHTYVLGPNHDGRDTGERLQKEKMRRKSRADMELPRDLRGPSKLTFDEIFSFFKDITSGLHHLHSKGYIHRDLKPSNCLLQRDSHRTTVLISDFGEVQAAGTQRASSGATGTISYCAPEVLQRNALGTFGEFTTKSDIFSLGMIVYFMCFGRLPYSNADDINEEKEDLDQLRAEITQWRGFMDDTRIRPDLPEQLYKYLKQLLSVDPSERPSTEDILSHIKSGVALGDATSTVFEENSSRVSSLDSPRHRPSPQGRKQSSFSRPSSSLVRHTSVDNVPSSSPPRSEGEGRGHSRSHSRPTSPSDNSMVKRPLKIALHPSNESPPSPQQSPQLLLPAPPQTAQANTFWDIISRPAIKMGFRVALFFAKLLSLTLPCSPYTVRASLLYPLLGIATLDLVIPSFDVWKSIALIGIHVGLTLVAARHRQLCQGELIAWDGW